LDTSFAISRAGSHQKKVGGKAN